LSYGCDKQAYCSVLVQQAKAETAFAELGRRCFLDFTALQSEMHHY